MSDFNGRFGRSAAIPAQADMSVDAGLRAFMLGVYNKLALGLLISGALAWAAVAVPAVRDAMFYESYGRIGFTLLGMIVQWSPLAMLLVAMFTQRGRTAAGANLLYWGVVGTMGLSLGIIFLAYTASSIFQTFLITASAFGVLSLIGYTTKKDLTAFGSFLIMGLWGLIIASVVNMFFHSGPANFIISVFGVFIFAGLTAWDTQKLKMAYYSLQGDQAALGTMTSYGALTLYLDFVNLFLFLLRIFGGNRR